MLKVFSASSDEVVASIGTLNFCTEASDSPSFVRRLEVTLPKAFTTSSLLDASPRSLASVSPFPQFTACKPTMYWLPKREIDPASSALLPVRKQISCATSRVTRSLGWRPIKRNVSPILRSERNVEKGGLLQVGRRRLLQSVVEHCIAGRVGEVGQHDGVFLGQWLCRTRAEEVEANGDESGDE